MDILILNTYKSLLKNIYIINTEKSKMFLVFKKENFAHLIGNNYSTRHSKIPGTMFYKYFDQGKIRSKDLLVGNNLSNIKKLTQKRFGLLNLENLLSDSENLILFNNNKGSLLKCEYLIYYNNPDGHIFLGIDKNKNAEYFFPKTLISFVRERECKSFLSRSELSREKILFIEPLDKKLFFETKDKNIFLSKTENPIDLVSPKLKIEKPKL